MAKQVLPEWLELKASGTPCPVGTHLRAVVTATPRPQRGAKRVREGAQRGGGAGGPGSWPDRGSERKTGFWGG